MWLCDSGSALHDFHVPIEKTQTKATQITWEEICGHCGGKDSTVARACSDPALRARIIEMAEQYRRHVDNQEKPRFGSAFEYVWNRSAA